MQNGDVIAARAPESIFISMKSTSSGGAKGFLQLSYSEASIQSTMNAFRCSTQVNAPGGSNNNNNNNNNGGGDSNGGDNNGGDGDTDTETDKNIIYVTSASQREILQAQQLSELKEEEFPSNILDDSQVTNIMLLVVGCISLMCSIGIIIDSCIIKK